MKVILNRLITFGPMHKRSLLFLLLFWTSSFFGQKKIAYPLIQNRAQWPEQVLFSADVKGGKVFLEKDAIKYHFFDLSAIAKSHDEGKVFSQNDVRVKGHVYSVRFMNSNENAIVRTEQKQKAYYNYFLGNDESKWAGGCSGFGRVERLDFYKGVDFIIYSTDYALKYDFIVHPFADVSKISMRYDHADKISIENGRLKVETSVSEVYEQQPLAWQIINGEKQLVDCRYSLENKTVSFIFPKGYNKSYELIIDPELVFSTYSGSHANNFGYTATYDIEGNLYSGGSTFGQGYPTTDGAYQTTFQGGHSSLGGIDMGLTKYDASGTFLVWSTYMGGSGDDLPHSIVVNTQSELFVYGTTGSNNYPVTQGAIDTNFSGGTVANSSGTGASFPNGSDIVVTRFNQTCTQLIGSTYIGGSANDGLNLATALKRNYADEFRGEISLDAFGNPLIVSSTFSNDFPVVNAFQNSSGGLQDGVVMKLTSDLSTILWSSYIGGALNDSGFSIAGNSSGEIYLCGGTQSVNFLTQNNVIQTSNEGAVDGYVVRLSNNGQSILSCTFWGSAAYDQLYFIEIDNEDFVYVFGQTQATDTQMIINTTYGTPSSGNLLTKFNPALTQVVWSSVFGNGSGKPTLSPSAFLVDYCNRVYISGWGVTQVVGNALNPNANLSSMANMPTTLDAFDSTCSTGDFYMAVFDENMTMMEYATFFGGDQSGEHVDGGTSRFDRKGVIYQSVCAGCGGFNDFPSYPSNVWSAQNNNNCNNGVYKFEFQLPLTIADFDYTPMGCTNLPVLFSSTSSLAQTYSWSFGDGTTSNEENPTHTYFEPGVYTIMLAVFNAETCNSIDTIYKIIQVQEEITGSLNNLTVCPNESVVIGPTSSNPNYEYSWSPTGFLSNSNVSNPTFQGNETTSYTLNVQRQGCLDIYTQVVSVTSLNLEVPEDTSLCDGASLVLNAIVFPDNASVVWSDESSLGNVLNDNPQDTDIEVSPQIPTIYYVQITSLNCTKTEEVFVNLVSFQTQVLGDFVACYGDTVALFVQDPNDNFSYIWQPTELILSGQNSPSITARVVEETIFAVNSISPGGCEATDEITVDVSLLHLSDVFISAQPVYLFNGQSSQLNAMPEGFDYNWQPAGSLNDSHIHNPLATPEETTTYTVSITDGECKAIKSVTVYLTDFVCGPPMIYVPNTFTPNADNKNEKLFVRANQLSKLYFVIYSRWGEKIFESKSLEEGWDGTYNGRKLDPDVYVYYLEAVCYGGEEYFEQGNITLIR